MAQYKNLLLDFCIFLGILLNNSFDHVPIYIPHIILFVPLVFSCAQDKTLFQQQVYFGNKAPPQMPNLILGLL